MTVPIQVANTNSRDIQTDRYQVHPPKGAFLLYTYETVKKNIVRNTHSYKINDDFKNHISTLINDNV